MRKMRIVVVFPSGHVFDTPCVPNLVKALSRNGCEVDFYCMRNTATPPGELTGPYINVHEYFLVQKKANEEVRAATIGFFFWLLGRCTNRNNIYVAVGVRGLFVLGLLSYITGVKYVYNSLELYTPKKNHGFKARLFKLLERRFSQKAYSVIIQDQNRYQLFMEYAGARVGAQVIFPNAPYLQNKGESSSEHCANRKKTICNSYNLLLYSGGISHKYPGIVELVASASSLPFNYKLFLQSRQIELDTGITFDANKIIHNSCPLSDREYDSLVDSCRVGLAWYDTNDPNMYNVGMSSGKLAHYLSKGKPIIVNRLPIWAELIEKYRCGVSIDAAHDIGNAIREIEKEYELYSKGAYELYCNELDVEKYTDLLHKIMRSRPGNTV